MSRAVYFTSILILTSKTLHGYNSKITLTTASVRQSTSPKPTTIFRRINVEAHQSSNTSMDFIELFNGRRKKYKKHTFLYNLDTWCQFQPSKGNCNETLNKYYYNVQLDQCIEFNYSGCDGNKNNFESLIDCERLCKGVSSSSFLDQSRPLKSICILQPNPGLCLALMTKYYYDINEKTCKNFMYGGCGGNQNKFDTIFSCMATCGDVN